MNEFFLAENRTQSVDIDEDYSIEVRQLLVCEIDKAERFAFPVREALKDNWVTADLHEVLNKNQLSAIILISILTTLTGDNALKIKNEAPEKFLEIFEAILNTNQDYFKKNKGKKSDKESTWFDSFQYLIANGHKHSDILNYSFGTFVAYSKAAQKLESASLLNSGSTMRVAYHADKKGFEQFTKNMKI